MAHEGSWSAIEQRGLLTTRQLVDAAAPSVEIREAALGQRRARSIILQDATYGKVSIRDQAPLRPQFLGSCLSDMSEQEWLDVLNGRVFFWLSSEKLNQLLNARLYRDRAHDVLTLDTASLLLVHGDNVRLSPINSGATLYPNAPKRGSETFLPVEDYPYDAWRKRRGRSAAAVVELAVVGGVPDVVQHTVRVERRRGNELLEVLWEPRTA